MIPFLVGGAAVLVGGLAAFSGATARKVEAEVPPDGQFLEVDGNRIHYVDKGSGPPLLLIHGLAGQIRNFSRLVDDLARDHRVVLIDRPGSGYSTRAPGASARLSAQAETVAHFIRALGLERPVLVGHSLGGALALAVALNHPEAVGGLALICPLTQPQEISDVPPVFRALVIRSSAARRAVAWTIATPLGIARSEAAMREVFAPEPVPEDFGTAGGGLLSLRPAAFYANSSDLVALEDELPAMAPRYGGLSVPVSILYARADNLLDPAVHGERTAGEIPGAEIEIVDGGHMLPFTQPESTARWIRAAASRRGAGDGAGNRG